MRDAVPNWGELPSSIIGDYLRESCSYGFGQALERLLIPAYRIIKARRGPVSGEEGELCELASLLSATAGTDEYRFDAYYFTICVAAVSFFGVPVDAIDCDGFDENELMRFDCSVSMEDEPDPQRKRLKRFGIRLLDYSRTNQLVHFRPIKSATMELFCADPRASIRHLFKEGAKLYLADWGKLHPKMIYRCKICGKTEVFPYDFGAKRTQPARPCPVCDAENAHNRKSLIPIRERLYRLPQDGYHCACGHKIGFDKLCKSELKCPKCKRPVAIDSAPFVSYDDFSAYETGVMVSTSSGALMGDVAKTLSNKAKTMDRNFGLHVLYLAYGFLKWKDANGTEYQSPLLLCPINLGVDKSRGQYYFELDASSGGKFELNKTLIQMLAAYSRTVSISLPTPDPDDPMGYFSLLSKRLKVGDGAITAITRNWEIDTGFGIGLFHYQKLQLHADIEENGEKYLQHPIVRRLCGDATAAIASPVLRERSAARYVTLDADSSQDAVIKAAQEGRSFILQGPPGSGKSQTITNIITSALGEGKSVLFVTEKASARSVIFDNLARRSLSDDKALTDYVLDFDSFRKHGGAVSRAAFIEELNRCLFEGKPVGGYDDQLLADEELRYKQIKTFMGQMRGDFGGRNYLRLLQDMAQYSDIAPLGTIDLIPSDGAAFIELCDAIEKGYEAIKACGCGVETRKHPSYGSANDPTNALVTSAEDPRKTYEDSRASSYGMEYRKHPLYGCIGDTTNKLATIAENYREICDGFRELFVDLRSFGWSADADPDYLTLCVKEARLWAEMPRLSPEILEGLSEKKVKSLLARAADRCETIKEVEEKEGSKDIAAINKTKLADFDLGAAWAKVEHYRLFIRRCGRKYNAWLKGIFDCFKRHDYTWDYASAVSALERLRRYANLMETKESLREEREQDIALFGFEPIGLTDWEKLRDDLAALQKILSGHDRRVFDLTPDWIMRFRLGRYYDTVRMLRTLAERLDELKVNERRCAKELTPYMRKASDDFLAYEEISKAITENRDILAAWRRLCDALTALDQMGMTPVWKELADSGCTLSEAKDRLSRTFCQKTIEAFVNGNGLTCIRDFDRDEHERLMQKYAETDMRVLSTSTARLCEALDANLREAAAKYGDGSTPDFPKFPSKTDRSIKQFIFENYDYIKRIKPCFMMSPLNVSQYLDIGISFDLVIFDEASQIFTEDALAAIVRGRQVIIAGDSKQLPPCDFFRAGESLQDDEEQYYEEEANVENSLLNAADEALSDASVSLSWHYRSCDEALIDFSNREMEYNLISFPSATRNVNDGIRYVPIPYDPNTCYDAGKGGTHINAGEADRIVQLIYSEMIHPERRGFSIGVVAFSNAQAFEIETRWEEFKRSPEKKDAIEAWEQAHGKEPLIFCNLDTVQGDERDTTIISVCYSADRNGRFSLPYLGRIRLSSGRKRINVAVTRAKHRMIVVSTLKSETLRAAIRASSAPEDNKSGAQMLCNFLEYAQSFSNAPGVVCKHSADPFVASVCKVLDEANLEYDTEIGRSGCKVSIGVRRANEKNNYILGIIIDDPGRTDFDSVREYTRLTEQVLSEKYGWKIYRVYPTAWIENYEAEKQNLMSAIMAAYQAS